MIFRIVFLVAIVIGMGVFLIDKWTDEEEEAPPAITVETGITAQSPAFSKTPAPRRPNSAGNAGVGYKYEYQDESGHWVPVMEFSQIPARFRGHFRPITPQTGAGAAASNPRNQGQSAQHGNASATPRPGTAPEQKDKDKDQGPGESEKALSDYQKKQAEDEAMYKEWGAKCRNLAEQLNLAQKAWDEIKDSTPPCQLKEEDCYQKYDEYKAKLLKDIENFNRDYNECREGARKAGVPPGYLR